MPANLATAGSTNRKIELQAGLDVKRDPISKITKAKRAGDMVQALQHLPSKCEVLSSNSSTTKKKKKGAWVSHTHSRFPMTPSSAKPCPLQIPSTWSQGCGSNITSTARCHHHGGEVAAPAVVDNCFIQILTGWVAVPIHPWFLRTLSSPKERHSLAQEVPQPRAEKTGDKERVPECP
jgi:hypothetical protein